MDFYIFGKNMSYFGNSEFFLPRKFGAITLENVLMSNQDFDFHHSLAICFNFNPNRLYSLAGKCTFFCYSSCNFDLIILRKYWWNHFLGVTGEMAGVGLL